MKITAILLSTLLSSTVLYSCKHSVNLKVGEANAVIGSKSVHLGNAQSGINRIGGGLYSTLSIVFGTSNGEGIGITLASKKDFGEKTYIVKHVEHPDEENAQLTYYSPDKNTYEALGNIGSGSVTILELTDTHIKGTFSGKYILQGGSSPVLEIKNGEFNAKFTPPVDEF